jgi:hypothetical protein
MLLKEFFALFKLGRIYRNTIAGFANRKLHRCARRYSGPMGVELVVISAEPAYQVTM